MKYLALASGFVLCAACTAANPLYVGPGGGLPDGGAHHDLSSRPADLAGGTHPDLAVGCSAGMRTCQGSLSLVCMGGLDGQRHCPADGTCQDGYCQPPAAATPGSEEGMPCLSQGGVPFGGACRQLGETNLSCEPFVSGAGGDVTWVCADNIGAGDIGTTCTRNGECASGFCGSNGTCFRACDPQLGCPPTVGGQQTNCDQVDITVEGVKVTAASCIP